MPCPTQIELGKNLTFTVQYKDGTGTAADASGNVAYSIYEDETATPILTGTMSKLAAQTGFYSEQIACTAANGFEKDKTYTIRITATIDGIEVITLFSVMCIDAVLDWLKNVTEGDAYIDKTTTPYQLVIHKKGDVLTEYIRKDLKDVDGENIISETTIIGRHKEP